MTYNSGFTHEFPIRQKKDEKKEKAIDVKPYVFYRETFKVSEKDIRPDYAKLNQPNAKTRAPSGFSPLQLTQAYKTDLIQDNPTGKGVIIGIINAYSYATVTADFTKYCQEYGLKTPNVITDATKLLTAAPAGKFNFMVKPMGTKMTANTGWAQEQALDIQMAHAMAPDATILLVQATSASYSALSAAIKYAVSVGAKVISNSWGGGDSSSYVTDTTFLPNNGVIYTASAGDAIGVNYPSTNPNVISTGGTNLTMSQVNGRWTRTDEKAWYIANNNATGGGASLYQPATYQNNGNTSLGPKVSKRCTPDISAVSDPTTGVAVCYNNAWAVFGGTSAAAPIIAGMIALANELRLKNSKQTISTSVLKNALYNLMNTATSYPAHFYDVKTGGTGSDGTTAVTGYDLMTGVGAPNCDSFIPWIASL